MIESCLYWIIANRIAVHVSLIEPRHVYTIINKDCNEFKTLIAITHNIKPEVKNNLDVNDSVVHDVSNVDFSCSLSESIFSKKK